MPISQVGFSSPHITCTRIDWEAHYFMLLTHLSILLSKGITPSSLFACKDTRIEDSVHQSIYWKQLLRTPHSGTAAGDG